jgi:hypothetical protein
MHIHWAWVPAAVFSAVVAWFRYGPVVTLLAIVGGLAVALYAEWRARRRARSDR